MARPHLSVRTPKQVDGASLNTVKGTSFQFAIIGEI